MADENSMSVVNLGTLSKPADTLIKKVSSAVGGIFEPWQMKRVAKAKAEVNLIEAKSEIETTDLQRRAMHRFVEEEANRQENMEEIIKKALPQLNEESNPNLIDDDWITNFFDKSRIVSDTDMQELWASVLAGESNSSGAYSKRTVNFLGDLDKDEADLFVVLCGFGWNVGGLVPLIFDVQATIYNKKGINFSTLSHLDSIGLIQFDMLSEFNLKGMSKTFEVSYFGQSLLLTMKNEKGNEVFVGQILLTQVGRELASVCKPQEVDGFFEYVKGQWKKYLPGNEKN